MTSDEFFDGIKALLIFAIIGLFLFAGCYWVVQEVRLAKSPIIRVEATLIDNSFMPSTRTTHVAPVFNSSGGMSTAVYSTGHDAKYTTIWDCGQYGRLTCDRKRVYRFARASAILHIKSNNYDTRIVGIE